MASDNTTTTQPNPLYGIKVAKAGYDAQTATDYELLFSSGWPSLAIAYSTTVTTLPNGVGHIPHPLGFPPFTMAWAIEGGVCTRRTSPQVDDNLLYFTDIDANDATYLVECYNLDITKQASYSFIPPPPAAIGVYDPDYGAKFAKPGEDVNSKNLDDFIFHTKAMSPAVLSVNTTFDTTPAIANSRTITTSNPLITFGSNVANQGYVPWAFGYGQTSASPGIWNYAPVYAQDTPRLFVNLVKPNSFTLVCDSDSPGGSLIMLRDPLFVANSVSVTY